MAKHYRLAVHDMAGRKLCDLYDSSIAQMGSARSIKITKEIEGWKEIEFLLSKQDSEGNKNYRFDFIRNENLLYLYEDGVLDIYCIKVPIGTHDPNKIQLTINCNHLSEELKAKNLFKYFDDENGIGTCEELITRAIAGTGWTLVVCDKFFEADGATEKVRSYSCDTKTGAWNMIAGICELFKAHPIFHGADRTIEIRSNDDTTGWREILFGKNSDKIVRTPNSSNLVTRLYVEGEYGEHGYVGIDDVNPTGLPFILNFDYYKELGVFTDEHQAIVDQYLQDYKENSTLISTATTNLLKASATLNNLIGSNGYVYVPVIDETLDLTSKILGGGISEEQADISDGDIIAIVSTDGSYSYVEYVGDMTFGDAICIFKFVPTITGTMAAREDLISSSTDSVERYLEELNEFLVDQGYSTVTVADLHSIYEADDLSIVKNEDFDTSTLASQYKLNTTLEYVVSIGTSENIVASSTTALQAEMLQVIDLIKQINTLQKSLEEELTNQGEIENSFCIAMGTMLRDGYWSDNNYATGQEESLYQDALEISAIVSRPAVAYSVDTFNLSLLPEFEGESFDLGNTVRIYDPDLFINDYAIVSKTVEHPDKPTADVASLKTDLLDIGTKTFSTILERVTELAEQVRQNKDIYQRAVAISKDGTINSDILNGAIDVLKTRLLSTSSNWTTDDKGNIIFTALDGSSVMMLCGNGFMIANSKKENGDWDWRTFGTGEGFTADLIVAGFISAERIQAHSITVDHLASNVGESLDLTSNESIKIAVENAMIDITDEKIVAIVRDSEEYKSDLAAVEMTSEKFEAFVENNESIAQIKTEADKIALVVEGEDSEGRLVLTDEMLEAVADNIDLSANESIKLIVDSRSEVYRGETPPTDAAINSLWIQPSTQYTFQRVDEGDSVPYFWIDDSGILYYSYEDGSVVYEMYMDDNGDLYVDSTSTFILILDDTGNAILWARVKDSDLSAAELKITDSAIISTVVNSAQYTNDFSIVNDNIDNLESRVSSAEQKITADAIVSTVVSSEQYASDFDEVHTDIDNLKSRVGTAEQKITADAIVSTVTESETYRTDLADKASASAVTAAQSAANAAQSAANANAANISALTTRVASAEQKITADAIISTVTESVTYHEDINSAQSAADSAYVEGTEAATLAQEALNKIQNTNTVTETLQSQIEQLSEQITLAVMRGDLETYLKLITEGVLIGVSNSAYNVLITNTGINIRNYDDVIASFIKRQLTSPSVRIAAPSDTTVNRCVMRVASDGGMMIVSEEAIV